MSAIAIRSLKRAASRQPGLRLLLLHGSRARGEETHHSDWDIAYLADERFDPDAFRAALVQLLGTEHIDLVDLARAGAQLRFRAARDGQVAFASDEQVYPRFWHEAVSFWCDAGAILRRGYADILESLTRS